ncbi:CDP-glycerol glycerophosphotransferase family protein [Staphylococcus pettenkoferi]|uniref:CDP-glycerol glycerophosphotransferase family protein n=1 Tax=Staphylococcus pettenkoferi TaxID=170573 RepID=UPI0022724F93|nr:CDP-glycerol glycerophosphotransferase family protein [Staphylococcus pettenkoferi]MCY1590437.1 CDP-glycerol glycerophosphotransferase family protein [Staphylococcus pettenkoferi]MCY1600094.1 CDP-glycerol glycerophosphotransferase family protein [Staphylococcus pettenkoferi]MCY1614349.1 CDP-glycerol glycerophosphotransferase family protein [Staphylococcus pettenkoferi]
MVNINVQQRENILEVDFNNYNKTINCIYVKNEYDSIKYENSGGNDFKINLTEVCNQFKDYENDKVYFIIEETDGIITTQKKLKTTPNSIEVNDLNAVVSENYVMFPYITKNGIFQFSFKEQLPAGTYIARRHIDKIEVNKEKAYIEGKFSMLNSTLVDAQILIMTRVTNHEYRVPIKADFLNYNKKLRSESYAFNIDLFMPLVNFLRQEFDPEDIIDIYLEMNIKESKEPVKIKLGNPRILAERFLKGEIVSVYNNRYHVIVPYFTMKGRNLSFKLTNISKESYKTYKECLTKRFKNLLPKNKGVWVVGEKSYKAQDNGYHFFKYMREHHPDKPVYYIIDKNSEEAKNVEPLGNVIDYLSPEHFKIMLDAEYIFTTHHPELIFPSTNKKYVDKIKAKRIFLQHGVLGTKNLSNINGKQLKDFNVDMFITSSEREKQIVVRDLKFNKNEVKVTGLPRFDKLFDEDTTVKKQVLIIPTWRDWITNSEQLLASDYYHRIENLLNASKIKELHDQGFEIVFCLHPNMQPYLQYFNIPKHVTAIKQGEVNVQQLIKESALMITDYSSVGFDFSFLQKPVIYYQFDTARFLGNEPSHLNIEAELPGYIVNDQTHLENMVSKLYENNFHISDEVKNRVNKFRKYYDTNNSERIYEEVQGFKKINTIQDKVQHDILTDHLFKRFRKSSKYFKVMSLYNKLLTRFGKVDDNLILFESNVGKSVSDSPKQIYDALKKVNDKFNIVWVNNTSYPFDDPNVTSIERLSPSYYKYLSKAKYWINNQNFPHYIEKNKGTTYIQTWHGTPLKKMLNDVESFEGRGDGYKDRVNTAISRWDYLVSPSPYATKCFKSAFNFKKEVLEVGYPRNDIFYSSNQTLLDYESNLIKQRLGIKDDRKLILYAPTFRDDEVNAAKKHTINLQLNLEQMRSELEDDYILLLRPHIIISNSLSLDASLDNFVIDVSKYNEISELYLISDICITDYSSVMFDYANTKKPLLFYVYDLDHYRDDLRGFYMDFENEAPGPFSFNTSQLVSHIKSIQKVQKEYTDKYQAFYNKYCTFETGHAAEEIVNRFFR